MLKAAEASARQAQEPVEVAIYFNLLNDSNWTFFKDENDDSDAKADAATYKVHFY